METYKTPYDPKHPMVCMDELPVQLIKETRQPMAATKNHSKRVTKNINELEPQASLGSLNSLVDGDKQQLAINKPIRIRRRCIASAETGELS